MVQVSWVENKLPSTVHLSLLFHCEYENAQTQSLCPVLKNGNLVKILAAFP